MKFKRSLALILTMLFLSALAAPAAFAESKVVRISTPEDLRDFAQKCRLDSYSEGLTAVLANDIDLMGEEFEPIGSFSGTFNGNDHTISGLKLSSDGAYQGLFRYLQSSGTIRRLNVQGSVNPESIRQNVGGIVSTNFGTVTHCSFDGEVRGLEKVGGIVGENLGTVSECTVKGTIAGKRFTGGIVGYNSGTVSGCKNYAQVNTSIEVSGLNIENISITDLSAIPVVTANDSETVTDSGGIVGLSEGIIKGCENYGTVGYQHYGYNVGGIAGRHSGYILECTNAGTIYGRKDIGGIVGQMEPYMLLTATESLVEELELMCEALNIAMTHLDINSGDTGAVLGDLEADASSAAESATLVNETTGQTLHGNAEQNESQNTEENKGIDWDSVKEKTESAGQKAGDIYSGIGDDTLGNLINGTPTEEDYSKLGETGTSVLGDLSSATEQRRQEREAEKAAEEEQKTSVEKGDFQIGDYEYSASIDMNEVSGSMDSMAVNIGRLNNTLSVSASDLANDMKDVNYHFYRASNLLVNILGGNITIYEDISDEDTEDMTDGKVVACVNNGTVDGDISIGGIGGEMGIELEYDLEGVIVNELDNYELMTNTFETRCVARECVNNGDVLGKKNNVGGVIGFTRLGSIIACEGYGNVDGTSASYVGGVVGKSDTVVRESYALCDVSGDKYVGGIAGSAVNIRNCGAMVNITNCTAASGAIVGWVDVHDTNNTVSGNTFVSDTLGGIDGISYAGKAQPVSSEEFLSNDQLPTSFKKLKLTFVADGKTVKEIECMFGQPIDEMAIPAVPEKSGYTGYWPEFDHVSPTSSAVLEAIYMPKQSSIASELTRTGEKPVLLVEGSFDDCARLELNTFDAVGPEIPGGTVLERWQYSIVGNRDEIGEHSVRLLPSEMNSKRDKLFIYRLEGESWIRVSTRTSGSYIVFGSNDSSAVFAVVEMPADNTVIIAASAAAAVVIAAAVFVILRKRGSRIDNA